MECENHIHLCGPRRTWLSLDLTTFGKNKCLLAVHFKLCLFSPILFKLLSIFYFTHLAGPLLIIKEGFHQLQVPWPCAAFRGQTLSGAPTDKALWDLTRNEGWRETRHLRHCLLVLSSGSQGGARLPSGIQTSLFSRKGKNLNSESWGEVQKPTSKGRFYLLMP